MKYRRTSWPLTWSGVALAIVVLVAAGCVVAAVRATAGAIERIH